MFIDTHAHIDAAPFDSDRDEVRARARAAGVDAIILAGAARTASDMQRTAEAALAAPELFASCGVHPHEAQYLDDALFAALEETSHREKIVAIGETGLDYHYDHSPRDQQLAAFARHLELAESRRLPVICHIRDAHPDARTVLAGYAGPGVIHCFTGGPDDAAAYLELGFYLSFSGVITFGASAEPVRRAAQLVPRDRLLIETDAPYLAPVPMRGGRNEPAFIVHTATYLAKIRGESTDEVAEATTANARRLFGLSA